MAVPISTLSNGIRVATDSMKGVETVTLQVCVDIGSRYETENVNGISHFLEHMAFKGTKRRTAQDIAREFDELGGNFNAFTSREHTVYYAKVLKNDLPAAMDILADILQHSTFDEEELIRERGVVLQEIAQNRDTPDDLIFDLFQETAYPNQPLGRSILGPETLVSEFSRKHLTDYVGQYYRGSRIIIAAAGNIDHKTLVSLTENTFNSLEKDASVTLPAANYQGGDIRKAKDLEQVHFILGFKGLSYKDDQIYTVQLLSLILGGGMSSRLFQEIREKRGLAYSVYSFTSGYHDDGLLGIYAGTGEEYLDELIPVTCEELVKMIHSVTEEELILAKKQVRTSLLMGQESTYSRAEDVGRHMLCFGRHLTIEEILEKVDATTTSDIQQLMEKLLKNSKPTLAAIGNIGRLESYETLLKRF